MRDDQIYQQDLDHLRNVSILRKNNLVHAHIAVVRGKMHPHCWNPGGGRIVAESCAYRSQQEAQKLGRSTKVCQRVAALIKLRNELVHYKPEWDDRLDAHKQVKKKFQAFIPPRLLPKDFPKDYMTCDFAAKAVEWCSDFAKDFFSKLESAEEQVMWVV